MAKSVFFGAFLSLCYVSTTLAALALGPAQVHPSQPNFCFQESKEKFYKPGETWTLEGCMQAECVMVSNSTGTPHLMVSYASCGIAAVDPPCYLTENKAAAYPDCCPEPVCPDSVEEEQEEKEQQVTPVENQKEISSTPSTSSSNSQTEQKYEMEERKGESMEASSEDSSENEIHYNSHHHQQQQQQQPQQQYYQPEQYHHQQQPQLHQRQEPASEEQRRILSDFFRGIYPTWDDDYLYGGDSHMDNSNINNVDDLQYLDYNPASRSRFSLSPPRSRFTRHDFNIANFQWF